MKTLATGFGFGLSPAVPGTTGTIPGLIIAWFLFPGGAALQTIATLLVLAIGVWVASEAEAHYGHDSKKIVIDEIAGIMVSCLYLPHQWFYFLCAFIAFRVFDVWKPAPARQWENWPRGWGVMADDLAAGIYANIAIQMLVLFRIGM